MKLSSHNNTATPLMKLPSHNKKKPAARLSLDKTVVLLMHSAVMAHHYAFQSSASSIHPPLPIQRRLVDVIVALLTFLIRIGAFIQERRSATGGSHANEIRASMVQAILWHDHRNLYRQAVGQTGRRKKKVFRRPSEIPGAWIQFLLRHGDASAGGGWVNDPTTVRARFVQNKGCCAGLTLRIPSARIPH